ncbi:50S ribosomal protein L27 [Candidatus Vidania fulgoroideorum]
MAKKKAVGSLKNGRDSKSKRLGLKIGNGRYVTSGNILIRQRGLKYLPGKNTKLGKDFTIYCVTPGYVGFKKKKKKTIINVI